jgi:hypothetical protein
MFIGDKQPIQSATFRVVSHRHEMLQNESITPVHRWMAPAWQELLRRFQQPSKSGCGHRSGLILSGTIVRWALMVVR